MYTLLTFLFLTFCVSAETLVTKKYDQQWLNLYRYDSKNISAVTNDSFFFHPEGRHSPDKEFLEAIKVLKEDPKKRCQFPARTLYLNQLGLISEEIKNCPKYEYFKRKVKLENVWLVFASYYVNNPSSAFGHTLFKLQGVGNDNDLLEYGVNFAAQMTTQNPLLYALFGLTGGFKGNFSLLPYFIKITEYNDSETRDLWEYKLNLTESEKKMFLAHLWEMDQARFDYYYLTENCSYHLLLFLDAIRPELNFKERMSYFVLPGETLSLVNQIPNFVSDIKVRPSQFKKTQARHLALSKNARLGLKGKKDNLSEEDQAHLLDFKIDLMDLEKGKLLFKRDPSALKEKRSLQGARAKLSNVDTEEIVVKESTSPHFIHPSRYLSAGYEKQTFSRKGPDVEFNRLLLTYRFSFHEYMDPQIGAPPWSQLMLGKVEGAYDEERKCLELKKFTLFKTEANQENWANTGALSWGLEVGARNHPNTIAYDLGPYMRSLVGVNWRVNKGILRLTLPVTIDYSRPDSFGDELKIQGKALAQWMTSPFEILRLNLALGAHWGNFQAAGHPLRYVSLATQIDLTKRFSLKTEGELLDKDTFVTSSLLFYF
ncbi:MAG: DUF4105 domain-containing protein [Bacteriovoracaceae bacterium]|nr:DUF4105 domain-containing protein [Bacteriovoracaceae bacterium]